MFLEQHNSAKLSSDPLSPQIGVIYSNDKSLKPLEVVLKANGKWRTPIYNIFKEILKLDTKKPNTNQVFKNSL